MLRKSDTEKHAIRQSIRSRRVNLTRQQLEAAQLGLVNSALQCNQLRFAKRILSYAPFDGEISPVALVERLTSATLYLPKINNYRNCSMQIFPASRTTTKNRFGILEPQAIGSPLNANQVDIILLPLVGFDRHGNRLGMGAGYYDRALRALAHQTSTRPILIGLAHHFQELGFIESEKWDVPLDAILTDREYIRASN